MIDLDFIRKNPERVQEVAQQKNVEVNIKELLELDAKRRQLQGKIDALNTQRNEQARQSSGGKPTPEAVAAGRELKEKLGQLEKDFQDLDEQLIVLWQNVPNIPTDDTPVGSDESGNKVLRTVGEPRQFDFAPKPHWELGEALNVIDMEKASVVSGPRFAYLKGELVFLQFALVQLALAILTNQQELEKIITKFDLKTAATPFIPVLPPILIKADIMQEMARLEPKEDRYHIATDDLYLIGSAEHTLGPIHRSETLLMAALPKRYLGYSPAFRREAGSHGKDVRGIMRLHQFDKVEMESFSTSDQGLGEHELFVAIQEELMQRLELPYQVVLKCTADMGTPNARAVDIEVWLPSENKYRETHTADYMTDYQARRLKTKVKTADGKTEYAHMNDGTAFSGRPMIAILENNQQADGSITIPTALHPYLPFTTIPARD